MPAIERHAPGTFCWVDLSTTDPEGAKSFYKHLFGWEAEDMPTGDGGGVYTMFTKGGKYCAAASAMFDEQRDRGIPPHWNSYVAVDDLEVSAGRVAGLGGTLVAEPFDVLDAGRMAVLQDPSGAVVSMWQANRHPGAQVVGEHGTLTWNELWTAEPGTAGAFYTELFGWAADTQDYESSAYTSFSAGGRQVGGMLPIAPDWGPVPPHWAVYFAVDDCDSATGRGKDLGAEVRMPPSDYPGIGRAAILADPQGAAFSIIASQTS